MRLSACRERTIQEGGRVKAGLKNLSLRILTLSAGLVFFLLSLVYPIKLWPANPRFTIKENNRQKVVRKYRGFEVKTGIVNDEIQYSLNRENSVEFTINEKCELESIKIKVGEKEYGYRRVERVVEDGRLEKNDLFAYICYQPEVLDGGGVSSEEVEFKFYRGKISPLITPDYPLFDTLRLGADRLGLKTPQRTMAVLNGFGNASHEFFCYLEGAEEVTTEADECALSFDEVLEIHYLDRNSTALMDLGDKYARRLDYERAEKAYLKGLSLPGENDYRRLVDFYLASGQTAKARKYLQSRLKQSSMNFELQLLLARVYLQEKNFESAITEASSSLKLNAERGQYESYAILGRALFGKQNFVEGIKAFRQAAILAEKECQDNRELFNKFFNQEQEVYDCRLVRIPFEQAIIYGLIVLEEYEQAERGAGALIKTTPNDPYNYGWLAFIRAARGQFTQATEQAEQCLVLFKRRGLGASIGQGEVYPQIISVQKGTPADRAGLKKGDRIVAVNGKDLRLFREQEKPDQALSRLVRQAGEKVKLIVHPLGASDLKTVELSPEEFLGEQAGPVLKLKELIGKSRYKVEESAFRVLLDEFYNLR